ncbi:MAG: BtrH N-terminal domain-containing protein [Candidatus Brockarchaeota archaeon]|nr:BtrH N-terminal domain-containing protein [Candidatus Brockarchaeota archaeon]
MRRLVGGVVHRTGFHSSASALRDVLEYKGCKLSEEAVFGIGCGLGFMYWRSKDMAPPILIGGDADDVISEACKILGIGAKVEKTESVDAAWKGVKELVDRGEPVALRVDLHHLGYLGAPMDLHSGRHVVVAAGYDEERGEAYVWDNRLAEIQTISLENLSRARGSKSKPFPPSNAWYELSFPKGLTKIEGAVRMAIRENAENFLYPAAKNSGLKGIEYFAEQLESWPGILSPQDLKLTLKACHIFIGGGNGTGLLRRMYSGFLREAHALLGDGQLEVSRELLERSAGIWIQVGELLLKGSGSDSELPRCLSEAKAKILECYGLEAKAFELLESLSRRWLEQVI